MTSSPSNPAQNARSCLIVEKTPLTEEETHVLAAVLVTRLNLPQTAASRHGEVEKASPTSPTSIKRKNHRRDYWSPRSWTNRFRS